MTKLNSKTVVRVLAICMLLLVTVTSSITGYASPSTSTSHIDVDGFVGIEKGDYLYDAVYDLADKGIIDSMYFYDTAFCGNNGETVAFGYWTASRYCPLTSIVTIPITDVEGIADYNDAYFDGKLDIDKVTSDTRYGVIDADKPVTLEQVAELMARLNSYLDGKEYNKEYVFTEYYLYRAKELGFIPYDYSPFGEKLSEPTTRGEVIEMLDCILARHSDNFEVLNNAKEISDKLVTPYGFGILVGDGQGNFNEDSYITQAELLTIAERVIEPTHRIKLDI